ncbi:MAG: zf-HC2 domain-containing protein [Betaproteobacteria bacterium]|nr:MAG: zf-HC2 domain-containing protein [Betaproteobacteria bacterium]
MLSCKDVSTLLSDRLDRKLSLRERISLRIHLAMCTGCSRVERQLEFLREALSGLVKPPDRD